MPKDETERPSGEPDPRMLAELMALATEERRTWSEAELKAVFRHQMRAPVEFDLTSFDPGRRRQIQLLCRAEGLILNSVQDLFSHSLPPIDLLRLLKDYAKACLQDPDSPIPSEIATFLYYASILVARVRRGERISTIPDAKLAGGIAWLLEQEWVDPQAKEMLRELSSGLAADAGAGKPPA